MTQTWTHHSIKKRKAYYHVPFSGGRRWGSSECAANGKFQRFKERKSTEVEKSKRCSMLFPWGGVMQMRQASRFVPPSQKNFGGHLCRCGAKWLKWLSHLWVIQRRNKWVIGLSHPSVSAPSFLDDFLPLYPTPLTSSPNCFYVCLFIHFPFALSRLPFIYVFPPYFLSINFIFLTLLSSGFR